MMEHQLYIDGVLMDLSDDFSIVLDIKSNLFLDVTNITANNTYTVSLPKTVHNMTAIKWSDKPKAGIRYPYKFHDCRYIRNGLEIIKHGKITLMSIEDNIELSIYWGIFPAFSKLKEDDVKLNTLGITNRMSYAKYNVPNTRAEAIAQGIFYAYYNPYIVESETDDFGANYMQGKTIANKTYSYQRGKIQTGSSKNAYIGAGVITDNDFYCIKVQFYPTMRANFLAGGTDKFAGYAILDKNCYIIEVGAIGELQSLTVDAPANAAWIVCNVKATYVDSFPKLTMRVQGKMREAYSPYSNDEDFVGDDVLAGSEYKTSPKYLQPCVMVNSLLTRIKNLTGVSFEWSGKAKELIDTLVIPIISNKADDETVTGLLEATLQPSTSLGELSFDLRNSISAITQKSGSALKLFNVNTDCTLSLDVQIQYSIADTYEGVWLQCPMYIEMKVISSEDGASSEQTYDIGLSKYDDGNVRFEVVLPSDKIDGNIYKVGAGKMVVDLKANDKVSFSLRRAGIETASFNMYAGIIRATVNNGDSVPFGGSFPIGINMPDIKVLDFVRFLSVITGTFPMQLDDSGKVKFVEYDALWSNKSRAVDWTKRLIAQGVRNAPRKTEFTYTDYKRVNHYKWKEDEQTHTENDADLLIDNDTLEYEQDVWTFPFAASDGNIIPIRTSDDLGARDGGEYKECKERIMNLMQDKEQAALYFGIDLQDIFATKYENLANCLSSAHVITEYLNLSDLEILNFDETKPVYFAQYGSYFAVIEIKTTDNGYCEVTMIEI